MDFVQEAIKTLKKSYGHAEICFYLKRPGDEAKSRLYRRKNRCRCACGRRGISCSKKRMGERRATIRYEEEGDLRETLSRRGDLGQICLGWQGGSDELWSDSWAERRELDSSL